MKMSKSSTNTLFIGLALLIVALLGYYIVSMKKISGNQTGKTVEVSLNDHIRGSQTAAVTIVEFGDLQCPACAAYEPLVRQVLATHEGDVRLIFRHFPLTQIHANALLAAKYAEAAGIQGKFWEMHDMMYEHQKEWSGTLGAKDHFEAYAKTLGLDLTKLTVDAEAKSVEEKILAQYKEGVSLGVQGTPTFFIHGEKIENPGSAEAFSNLVKEAKAKVQK